MCNIVEFDDTGRRAKLVTLWRRLLILPQKASCDSRRITDSANVHRIRCAHSGRACCCLQNRLINENLKNKATRKRCSSLQIIVTHCLPSPPRISASMDSAQDF